MQSGRKCGSNWGCYYFLFEKTVKCFVQSPPSLGLNDKYPVNALHSTHFA